MKYRIVQYLLFYLFLVVSCCDVNFPLGLIKSIKSNQCAGQISQNSTKAYYCNITFRTTYLMSVNCNYILFMRFIVHACLQIVWAHYKLTKKT